MRWERGPASQQSCIPVILAALLAAGIQPAGNDETISVLNGGKDAVELCVFSSGLWRCGHIPTHMARVSNTCLRDGPRRHIRLRLEEGPGQANETNPADEGVGSKGFSDVWVRGNTDLFALFVRGGLIFLQFGGRPFRNAKKIISCCLICFALYRYQFPLVQGSAQKDQSPIEILLTGLVGTYTHTRQLPQTRSAPAVPVHAGQCVPLPTDIFLRLVAHKGNSTSWDGPGICMVSDGPLSQKDHNEGGGVGEDAAAMSSTWHFASIFLVIKLFSKTVSLLAMHKRNKKFKMIKLYKLAKLAKLYKMPGRKRSVKMLLRLLRMLKLVKLLKLSSKSKNLISKKHIKRIKPMVKSFKLFKLVQLFAVAMVTTT